MHLASSAPRPRRIHYWSQAGLSRAGSPVDNEASNRGGEEFETLLLLLLVLLTLLAVAVVLLERRHRGRRRWTGGRELRGSYWCHRVSGARHPFLSSPRKLR